MTRHVLNIEDLDVSTVKPMFGWENISTKLIRSEPSVKDINQGSAKDCILLSLLASYLHNWKRWNRPDPRTLIWEDQNKVFITDMGENKTFRIRKALPRGRHIYQSTDYSRSRAWVRFLELYVHCWYEQIAPAPIRAIYSIFGFTKESETNFEYTDMKTKSITDYKSKLDQGPVFLSSMNPLARNMSGVYGGHAYGILDIDTNTQSCTLFNSLPHDSSMSGYFGSKVGTFTLPWSEVIAIFTSVCSLKDSQASQHAPRPVVNNVQNAAASDDLSSWSLA